MPEIRKIYPGFGPMTENLQLVLFILKRCKAHKARKTWMKVNDR